MAGKRRKIIRYLLISTFLLTLAPLSAVVSAEPSSHRCRSGDCDVDDDENNKHRKLNNLAKPGDLENAKPGYIGENENESNQDLVELAQFFTGPEFISAIGTLSVLGGTLRRKVICKVISEFTGVRIDL